MRPLRIQSHCAKHSLVRSKHEIAPAHRPRTAFQRKNTPKHFFGHYGDANPPSWTDIHHHAVSAIQRTITRKTHEKLGVVGGCTVLLYATGPHRTPVGVRLRLLQLEFLFQPLRIQSHCAKHSLVRSNMRLQRTQVSSGKGVHSKKKTRQDGRNERIRALATVGRGRLPAGRL